MSHYFNVAQRGPDQSIFQGFRRRFCDHEGDTGQIPIEWIQQTDPKGSSHCQKIPPWNLSERVDRAREGRFLQLAGYLNK